MDTLHLWQIIEQTLTDLPSFFLVHKVIYSFGKYLYADLQRITCNHCMASCSFLLRLESNCVDYETIRKVLQIDKK